MPVCQSCLHLHAFVLCIYIIIYIYMCVCLFIYLRDCICVLYDEILWDYGLEWLRMSTISTCRSKPPNHVVVFIFRAKVKNNEYESERVMMCFVAASVLSHFLVAWVPRN